MKPNKCNSLHVTDHRTVVGRLDIKKSVNFKSILDIRY
jgi:hypothetical protein